MSTTTSEGRRTANTAAGQKNESQQGDYRPTSTERGRHLRELFELKRLVRPITYHTRWTMCRAHGSRGNAECECWRFPR